MLHGDVTDQHDAEIDRTAPSSGMAPSNAALIVLRDLGAADTAVRHLATTIYTPRALINQLLDELTGAGLVTDREPSVRGRTAAGEALLAEEIHRLGSADADDDDAWNELFDAVFDHAYEAASQDFDSGNGDNVSTALRYGAI